MTPDVYLAAVLGRARITQLSNGRYVGAVPGFPYRAVTGATPEDCRAQLETLLEHEVQRYQQQGMALPKLDDDLTTGEDSP